MKKIEEMTNEEYRKHMKEMHNDVMDILTRREVSTNKLNQRYQDYMARINELSLSTKSYELKEALSLIDEFKIFVSYTMEKETASLYVTKLDALHKQLTAKYFDARFFEVENMQKTKRMK